VHPLLQLNRIQEQELHIVVSSSKPKWKQFTEFA
jgi:hypothetical protein